MVRLLGEQETADGHVAAMPDGRRWGPFETEAAARGWESFLGPRCRDLATAREVFEGTVEGEGFSLVSPEAVEFGVHPFEEVYDVLLQDDNGMVVVDRHSGIRPLLPEAPVLVDSPVAAPRRRRLPAPRPAPREADVHCPDAAFPSDFRGEVVVARDGHDYLVCWRPDQRHRKRLPVLSLHTVEECALRAAKRAAQDHNPGPRRASRRLRDYQRDRLYRWELSFTRDVRRFEDIDEAIEFAQQACADLGVETPEITSGRRTLENHSYFSVLRGVVLQKDMLNSHTLLHELSHYLLSQKPWRAAEPAHGPRFAGVLAGMLSRFAGADIEEALSKAEEMGLDVDREAAAILSSGRPGPKM